MATEIFFLISIPTDFFNFKNEAIVVCSIKCLIRLWVSMACLGEIKIKICYQSGFWLLKTTFLSALQIIGYVVTI